MWLCPEVNLVCTLELPEEARWSPQFCGKLKFSSLGDTNGGDEYLYLDVSHTDRPQSCPRLAGIKVILHGWRWVASDKSKYLMTNSPRSRLPNHLPARQQRLVLLGAYEESRATIRYPESKAPSVGSSPSGAGSALEAHSQSSHRHQSHPSRGLEWRWDGWAQSLDGHAIDRVITTS